MNFEKEKELLAGNPVWGVVLGTCIFGTIIFLHGISKFFVGLTIAPIDTLAAVIGMASVPYVIGWIIAKVGEKILKLKFQHIWISVSAILILIMSTSAD